MSDIKKLFEVITTTLSERAGVEKKDVRPESFFMDDLNIDEMELGEIVAEIEEKLNVELDMEIEELKTVGDLLHALQEATE